MKKQEKRTARRVHAHIREEFPLIAIAGFYIYNVIMFEESEIIALVVALVGAFLLIFVFARRKIPELGYFYLGFFSIAAASLFTVIEGVLWKDFFNFLEHLSYTIAGISFIVGCRTLMKQSKFDREGP